jgi:hypothetical protein
LRKYEACCEASFGDTESLGWRSLLSTTDP